MRALILAVFILLVSRAAAAQGEPATYYRGEQLYEHCTSQDMIAQGTCYGYVLAVADAAIMELTGARWRACISERRSRHVR